MDFQIAQRDVREIPGKERKKAIIFDKGGVLTNRDYSEIYKFLGETLNLSQQDLQVAIKEKKILDENFWKEFSKSHQQKVSLIGSKFCKVFTTSRCLPILTCFNCGRTLNKKLLDRNAL